MKKARNILIIFLLIKTLSAFTFPVKSDDTPRREERSGYLSDLERDVIDELNLARSHPETYANFLSQYSKLFLGRELCEPGEITIITNEGRSAVNEAIRFLENQKSLPTLTASKGMSKAATDMVRMQETTNRTGHIGSDRSTFYDRISRYGTWSGSCSENIDYGYNSARRIVMALIIDDGVRNRGHRKSIYDQNFLRVGVACGQHRTFKYMCVIELAQSYSEK